MNRLSQTAVDELGGDFRRWRYDRAQLPVGIVHLGLGAFARAHLLSFTDDALERAFGPFGVCGVNLKSPFARDRLFPQDGLNTVAERSGEAERLRVIGCLPRRLMAEEVAPTLRVPADLATYQRTLLERFANPALAHRTAQIAMDGSQKLPQRLLGTVRHQLRTGGRVRLLCLAIAGWMRYAAGVDEAGRRLRLPTRWRRVFPTSPPAPAASPRLSQKAFCRCARCSATICRTTSVFVGEVAGWLRLLLERGARAAVAQAAEA